MRRHSSDSLCALQRSSILVDGLGSTNVFLDFTIEKSFFFEKICSAGPPAVTRLTVHRRSQVALRAELALCPMSQSNIGAVWFLAQLVLDAICGTEGRMTRRALLCKLEE